MAEKKEPLVSKDDTRKIRTCSVCKEESKNPCVSKQIAKFFGCKNLPQSER